MEHTHDEMHLAERYELRRRAVALAGYFSGREPEREGEATGTEGTAIHHVPPPR